jgi:hypothetical protein
MRQKQKNRGFTVFELLVTTSVFMFMTVSIISNYRSSTKGLLLNTLAHQIITEIRHAQTFALANVYTGAFLSHGIYFDKSVPEAFLIFSDLPAVPGTLVGNKTYDAGELEQNFLIRKGNTISKLCVNMKKDGVVNPANCTTADKLHITFTRPYPEPTIRATGVAAAPPTGLPYADAEIFLSSDNGQQKIVIISLTGQISIE